MGMAGRESEEEEKSGKIEGEKRGEDVRGQPPSKSRSKKKRKIY